MSRLAVLVLAFALGGCTLAPRAPTSTVADEGSGPSFEVRSFAVEGNTLLDPARIDALLAPWAGANRRVTDVRAAAAALQDAYRRAGWGVVTVAVPEQHLEDGRVRLSVQEPRLRDVALQGAVHETDAHVLQSLPELREGRTPNTEQLSRQLRLANENPSRRLSVDLRRAMPGQIDALVGVQDEKPWRVGTVIDDTGTAATGRMRVGAFLQHANVADLDHVATLQAVTSPEHPGRVHIAAVNYRVPLPALGDAIDLYGIHADVDSGVIGDTFQVRGRGTVAGLRYTRNLDPVAGLAQRAWTGLEHRVVENRVGLVGASADLVPDVTLHPVSLGYLVGWSSARTQLDGSATVVHNIPGGGNSGAAQIAAARTNASAHYTVLRWSASVVQALDADAPLRIAIEGQWTRDALVPAEQFGVGGAESVRGFDERELINDRGVRTTIELQTPDVGGGIAPGFVARGHLFLDQASLHRNRALPGETARVNVASMGAGARVAWAPHWQGRFDVAHVLQGGGVRPRGDERLHVSIGYAY